MLVAALSTACANGHTVEVHPYRTLCGMGSGTQGCLDVRDEGQSNPQPFYGSIEGFTFEWGYTQVLEVEPAPPTDESLQDVGGPNYVLRRVVSKTPMPRGSRLMIRANADDRQSWQIIAQGSCAKGYRLFDERDLMFETPAACESFAERVAERTETKSRPSAIELEVTEPGAPLKVVAVHD